VTLPTSSSQIVKLLRIQPVLRKYPRYLLSVPITVYGSIDSARRYAHGLTLELSQGGVSAVLCGSLQPAAIFQIEISLPRAPVRTLAVVPHSDAGRCGFEFVDSSPDFHDKILACLRDLEH